MQGILSVREGTVYLNSNLNEDLFAKTKFSRMLDNAGILVKKDADGALSVFCEWKFDGTKTIADTAYFCGPYGTPAGVPTTVEDILSRSDSGNEERHLAKEAIFAVCQAYSAAALQNVSLPCNGMAGVLYDGEQLLFVPEENFDRCAGNLGKEAYEEMQNLWRDSAANGKTAEAFILSVAAYYGLTGHFPFTGSSRNTRSANVGRRNFLPLEYCVNGIDAALFKAVNAGLRGEESKEPFPIEAFRKELFDEESKKHAVSADRFERAVKAFTLRQQKAIRRAQFWERHVLGIIGILSATAFCAVSAVAIVRESGKKPTVIGLSSAETACVFFAGIHHMSTDYMLAAAKDCPQAQRYISQVPQIFITAQMRGAFNFESGISTPENWMFFEPDSTRSYSHFIYGITNFTLDGEPSTLNMDVPTRKNHKHRITRSSSGKKIELEPNASHIARYYLVHTEDNLIRIDTYITVVDLEYKKNRWQITALDQNITSEIISPLPFSLDYKNALSKTDGNEQSALSTLRSAYPWIPTTEALCEEKARLDKIGY